MLNFALLAIPSILVVMYMKWRYDRSISMKEVIIHAVVMLVMCGVVLGITYAVLYSKLSDVEILNGAVTEKVKHTEWCTQSSSCKHYTLREKCRRSTDSKGKTTKSCTTYKDFDYSYEVDWIVKSTVGESEIERINRQGTKMPPRWAQVQIGEPASAEHDYYNYLFADEYSLFAEKKFSESYDVVYQNMIPNYPLVYDYYRANHVVNSSIFKIDDTYEKYLADVLKTMGKKKQVNIVVVLYNASDVLYTDALISKWRGGKKNDVIMMFGLDLDGKVQSFKSTSFAQGMNNEMLHATLRINALSEKMSLDLVKKQVHTIDEKFERLPNEEFKYMKYKMEPKKEVVIFCSIILLVISIFVGNVMRVREL